MSANPKAAEIDWHVDDDTESDGSDDTESDGSDGNKSDHKHEEDKREREYHHNPHKKNSNNYGGGRGGANKGKQSYFNRGDPNSNYEQFYKNDPDFFVKVMKKEEPPHELSVKITKDRQGGKDYSQTDFLDVLKSFGVEDAEISFTNQGGLRANITINSSDE
jgi:hypothetical protein